MKKFIVMVFLVLGFLSVAFAAPQINKEVVINYNLLQAYDANGGYYVELSDGSILTNVGSYRGLDKATRYQWNIWVHGKGIPGPGRNELLEGWVRTVSIGSGHAFESTVMYQSLMVSKSDPRYKNAIVAGPTPEGWVYVKHDVTYLGKRW